MTSGLPLQVAAARSPPGTRQLRKVLSRTVQKPASSSEGVHPPCHTARLRTHHAALGVDAGFIGFLRLPGFVERNQTLMLERYYVSG